MTLWPAAAKTVAVPAPAPSPLSSLPRALTLSLAQLADRRILRVLAQSMALTIAILIGVAGALWLVGRWFADRTFTADSSTLIQAALAVALVVAAWLLFRTVAMAVMGLFTDAVVVAVEDRHYPAARAAAVPVPWRRQVATGLRSAGRAIGYNLLAMPLYAVLAVTGVGLLIALWAVNALVLGRDLEAMASAPHPGAPGLSRAARWALGGAASALFLLPVVNLLAPILAAAMAVHMLHRPSSRPAPSPPIR